MMGNEKIPKNAKNVSAEKINPTGVPVGNQALTEVGERYKLPLEFLKKLLQIVRSYPPSVQSAHLKKLITEEVVK